MAKHEQLYAGPDGWSPWRWPVMRGFRMTCCDCGLVHDIDISIHKTIGSPNALTFKAEDKPSRGHRIRWRFKINARATGQIRRHQRKSG